MTESQPSNDDQRIQSRIAVLRQQHTDTRTLYLAVISMLFFEFGQTPTGNQLYNLVRKGSMSVPYEVLQQFWEDVRRKARVDIQHPGIPMELRQFGGDIIAGLWNKALESARREFSAQKIEIEAGRTRLDNELSRVRHELAETTAQLADLRSDYEAKLAQTKQIEDALAHDLQSERQERASATAQARELQSQLEHSRAQLQQMQVRFSQDLEKAQDAVRAADERVASAERKALSEIERGRQEVASIQASAEDLRSQLQHAQHREEQSSLSNAKLIASLTDATQALRAEKQSLQSQIETQASAMDEMRHTLQTVQQESLRYKTQAEAIQQTVEKMGTREAQGRNRKNIRGA